MRDKDLGLFLEASFSFSSFTWNPKDFWSEHSRGKNCEFIKLLLTNDYCGITGQLYSMEGCQKKPACLVDI